MTPPRKSSGKIPAVAAPQAPAATAQGEGWGRPWGSALRHYFVAGRALCGAWRYHGDVTTDHAVGEQCEGCLEAARLRASVR